LHARLEIAGHTDSDGIPETNLELSRARAAHVRDLFRGRIPAMLEVQVTGVGSSDPLVRATTEEEKQTNRRVAFRVVLEPTGRKAPSR
jgi:OOP family OmpA-OmpF porin